MVAKEKHRMHQLRYLPARVVNVNGGIGFDGLPVCRQQTHNLSLFLMHASYTRLY